MIFTGQLADPSPAMAAIDVFVQPGAPEAFGLVNVEAMAMEKPVVGFAHGGLPEIVIPGETGLLVAPGDEISLAEAVITLFRDPGRRAELGHAGRAARGTGVQHRTSGPRRGSCLRSSSGRGVTGRAPILKSSLPSSAAPGWVLG